MAAAQRKGHSQQRSRCPEAGVSQLAEAPRPRHREEAEDLNIETLPILIKLGRICHTLHPSLNRRGPRNGPESRIAPQR